MSVSLGDRNRFFHVHSDNIGYDYPIKKLDKIKGHLAEAHDVAFLSSDKLIVSDKHRWVVKIFENGGNTRKTLVRDIRPVGIATTQSGMVAVIDGKRKKEKYVKVYSSENADLFSKWGEELDWKPRGITFSNKGHLVITDIKSKKHSVGIYTIDGRQVQMFGTQGSLATNFNYPNYVCVDMFDRILVSDLGNNAVKVYDERGKFLGLIGQQGSGQLYRPRGICTDARGNIIVCDTGNRCVRVYSVDGRHIQNLLTPKDAIGYPYAVAYDKTTRKMAVSQYSAKQSGTLKKIRVYELDELPPLKIERA